MTTATRTEIEARLRGVSARLALRRLARAGFSGLGGAAVGIALTALLLDLLPRLLLSTTVGVAPVVMGGAAGFLLGAWYELRGFRVPSLQESALAMEARLEHDSGALGAALKVSESSVFAAPVMARASDDLSKADQAEAPAVISTRRLVLVPLIALLAGVAIALMLTAEPPRKTALVGTQEEDDQNGRSWADVDVGGGRSESDQQAYREALGMKKTAANLREKASTIRDAATSQPEREGAYQEAREAIDGESEGEDSPVVAPPDLPEKLPESAAEREEIARRIEDYADRVSASAEKKLKEAGGVGDSGENGEFEPGTGPAELIPFPEPAVREETELPVEALASQTPARRDLAKRAVEALEKIQKP